MSGYTGITGILIEECRHIHRYAGLTYMLYCAGAGEAGLPDLHRSLVRHIGLGYGQRSYLGYRSQLRCHVPAIKERFCSMERDHGGRVHSGGLPTHSMHKYSPYLTEVRTQSKRYKVQGCGVPSRAIRGKVKGLCLRQQVLFGV
jgi:hypothetical protein